MSVRIIYKEIAVGADEGASVTAQGQTQQSVLALLPFGKAERRQYATLEHNMWLLNGTRKVYNGESYSFWSEDFSGADCYFETPPEITINFDNLYSSVGINLDFGAMNYCSEIELTWYSDGAVLSRKTFYPDANEYFCDNRVENYNKIVIRLIRTSHPHTRARLNAVYFGLARTFRRDQLRSVKLTQQINLISSELPENVLDWQLNSTERLEYLFQFKQPVEAYDNDTLLGAFYIKNSNRKGARLYNIKCTDAIGVLDEEVFPDVFCQNRNAYDLAVQICDTFPVQMQEELKNKTVTGLLYGLTRRQALQQLCFAIGAVADTSGVQGVRIFVPSLSEPKEIPRNRVRVGSTLTTSDIVTEVQIQAHSYATSGEGGGVTVGGVTYYDTPITYSKVNPLATEADKRNVITIADATLVGLDNVGAILDRAFDFYMRRNTHKVSFRLEGEKMGDYISTPTNWGEMITGNYTRATVVLSGIAVTTAEVIGE